MDISDVENLEVYQLAAGIADSVWELVSTWRQFDKDSLGAELVRASDSIAASIAEGHGRESYLHNIRCVHKAIGFFNKTEHWIKIGHQRQLINDDVVKQLEPLLNELRKRLDDHLDSIGTQRPEHSSNHSSLVSAKSYAN